jgi:hypothetical protein
MCITLVHAQCIFRLIGALCRCCRSVWWRETFPKFNEGKKKTLYMQIWNKIKQGKVKLNAAGIPTKWAQRSPTLQQKPSSRRLLTHHDCVSSGRRRSVQLPVQHLPAALQPRRRRWPLLQRRSPRAMLITLALRRADQLSGGMATHQRRTAPRQRAPVCWRAAITA